ncbi:dihydrofolate reductase family protein [Actinokineospora soli]|uniref:Dihydrofolate reductase family protein n=1 Tax=Actinokineospora soli TaxID=1048753 RepID=A0ABW2TQN7_9PSEU
MGAETARQALALGLVDELDLQIVPVLLGAGARLVDGVEGQLEQVSVQPSSRVVHARYRVLR